MEPDANPITVAIATGNVDSDPEDEIIVAPGNQGSDSLFVYDDANQGYQLIEEIADPGVASAWKTVGISLREPVWPRNHCYAGGQDSDGDGLLDVWEAAGYDSNCDGDLNDPLDIPLHHMGVSPWHKDLLMQVDWYNGFQPTAEQIDGLRRTFARSPVDAGGVANPDGQLGIHVIVDAGNAVDATGTMIGDALEYDINGDGVIGPNENYRVGGTDFGTPPPQMPGCPTITSTWGSYAAPSRLGFFRWVISGPPFTPPPRHNPVSSPGFLAGTYSGPGCYPPMEALKR